jgi:hypothetical protein
MIMSTVPSVRPWLMSVSLPSELAGKTWISKRPLVRFLISSAAHTDFGVVRLAGLVDVRPLELGLREGAAGGQATAAAASRVFRVVRFMACLLV